MLEHGGNLRAAATRYNIPMDEWLDLSTGINPNGWPVPEISAASWLHLPQSDDGLHDAACRFYGAPHSLAVAGSQAAIQTLPRLRVPGKVGMLSPSYAEHRHAWLQQGHEVIAIEPDSITQILPRLDVLLLVNPNNPTATCFDVVQLLAWQQELTVRGGWLVVDEAFMDCTPEQSLAAYSDRPGLIILRSVGKFFGLAGARCGFVLAHPELLLQLQELLGPWGVSGPTREIVLKALCDTAWHNVTRQQLSIHAKRLSDLLTRYGLSPHGQTQLFQWVCHTDADKIHDTFARMAILLRRFDRPSSLRFGLPENENGWQRLEQALREVMSSVLKGKITCRV